MNGRLRYFEGVSGLRDAHRRYRELAKRLHPDNRETGNTDWFREMAAEYAVVVEALRARRAPVPIEPPTATQRTQERPEPSRHPKPSPELKHALEGLADAAGSVVAAWLKGRIR